MESASKSSGVFPFNVLSIEFTLPVERETFIHHNVIGAWNLEPGMDKCSSREPEYPRIFLS